MYLRSLQDKDAAGMLEWMHDPQIQKCFRTQTGKKDMADVMGFIRDAQAQMALGTAFHYAIADEDDEYLGTISLKEVHKTDRNAEYAISLRKKAQGRGIAAQATEGLLRKAFGDLGLERVYLNVLADNERAVRFYEKAGFIYEGESKNCLFLRGSYKTLKWYRILREEYFEKM